MKAADRKKLNQIKARCADVMKNQAADIRDGRFLYMAAEVVTELDFCLKLIDRLDADPDAGEDSEALEEATV